MLRFLSFIILIILFEVSCSYSSHPSTHLPEYLIAGNRDSIYTYQLTLLQNYNFYYAIIKKEQNVKRVESFKGTYKLLADTILLSYDKSVYFPQTTDYLVWEASKKYLLQNF